MTSPNTPPHGQPDPAALLALGLATHAAGAGASSAPPPTPAELAAEFPQLEILELLGRGGMGAVYKARQRDLERHVALKILRPGLDADPGFAERFAREARALAQLNHPGIVTLYEFGKTSAGRYFILMEFVDGVNLRQLLAVGRLSPREALAIVPPLCDALQYAHDRGLIHRDIKPENLLIDRLGRIKIADFGIAKITTTDPSSTTIGHRSLNIGHSVEGGGTPAYMAPEQLTHPAAIDHRADLYALGVVLYQMLTGELPAAGQLRPPSTRVQLDVRLDEIVLRALEKDPARRYAAASEFKTQVETVAASGSTSSPSSTTRRNRFQRIASSHWFRFLPVVLMLVILISTINRNAASSNKHTAQTTGSDKKSAPPTTESPPAPDSIILPKPHAVPPQTRLLDLKLELAAARAQYGARHPNLLALEAKLSALEAHTPPLPDETYRALVAERRSLLLAEKAALSTRYTSKHPKKTFVQSQLEALDSILVSLPAAPINISVFGEVARPGAYAVPADANLLDALAAAGGWTAKAQTRKISVLSPPVDATPSSRAIYDLSAILRGQAPNPPIPANAVISIPERIF